MLFEASEYRGGHGVQGVRDMSEANAPQKSPTSDVPAPKPGVAAGPGEKGAPMSLTAARERAHKLYVNGQLQKAAQLCSQIVAQRPRMADAHNLLAAILHAQGKAAEAVKSMQRAIHLNGNNAQFYSNLGEMERQRGKLPEALVALRRALNIDPNSPTVRNNLGIAHYDRGEFDEAAKCYEQAIAINSGYAEAHNNLGNALRALGRMEEALEHYQRALLVRENYPGAYNNMAAILREQDQVAEAEFAYRKAIGLDPRYFEAYGNLATLLIQHDREDEALRVLGEALKIDPKHVPTLIQVARTQLSKGSHAQAEQACRFALQNDPNSAEAHAMLGEVLHESDRFTEALESYETALTLKPSLPDARNHYGICLKSVGLLDDAREQLVKSLELNPRGYGIYANLADLEKFTPDHPHLKAMEAIIQEASDPMSERYMALHFGLGKAYEDIGEYEKAFDHFQTGATLKRAKLKYDETETNTFFDSIREIFNADFFARRPFEGLSSDLPVFIIGMPRSGSTLVEQIVSSHPQASGAGEIKEFSRRLTGLRSRFPSLPKYPQIGAKMNQAHYKIVAEGYLSTLRSLAPNASRVTDKLLTNYYFVGMLHVMFPKAKFIHTKRNPVDTCWSAYNKLFKDDMPHSYDFGELGRYYKKYEELMAHWDTVLPPGLIKTVVYEDVVADLETSARGLLDFLGLSWDPACLSFHESDRPVKTASVVQVRKPVYKSSVEKWRHYGSRLQPLVDALGYAPKTESAPAS
jgi:tetratricopeptide (TPR) repeat protein